MNIILESPELRWYRLESIGIEVLIPGSVPGKFGGSSLFINGFRTMFPFWFQSSWDHGNIWDKFGNMLFSPYLCLDWLRIYLGWKRGMCIYISSHLKVPNIPLVHGMNEINEMNIILESPELSCWNRSESIGIDYDTVSVPRKFGGSSMFRNCSWTMFPFWFQSSWHYGNIWDKFGNMLI